KFFSRFDYMKGSALLAKLALLIGIHYPNYELTDSQRNNPLHFLFRNLSNGDIDQESVIHILKDLSAKLKLKLLNERNMENQLPFNYLLREHIGDQTSFVSII